MVLLSRQLLQSPTEVRHIGWALHAHDLLDRELGAVTLRDASVDAQMPICPYALLLGLGFRVQGSGLRVQGLGFRVPDQQRRPAMLARRRVDWKVLDRQTPETPKPSKP